MKVLNIFIVVFLSIFVFLLTTALTDKYDSISEKSMDESTFTLSGSVTYGHPELSWNSVSEAYYYKLHRLPVPYFGLKDKTFILQTTSFLDEAVNGAVLGTGLQQVRYMIDAYNSNGQKIDSAGPVDYTADSID